MTKVGIVPIIQRKDNEILKILIESIEENNLANQLASSHYYQLNPAERAIKPERITSLVIYMNVIETSHIKIV